MACHLKLCNNTGFLSPLFYHQVLHTILTTITWRGHSQETKLKERPMHLDRLWDYWMRIKLCQTSKFIMEKSPSSKTHFTLLWLGEDIDISWLGRHKGISHPWIYILSSYVIKLICSIVQPKPKPQANQSQGPPSPTNSNPHTTYVKRNISQPNKVKPTQNSTQTQNQPKPNPNSN